jgi:hypothetical protein
VPVPEPACPLTDEERAALAARIPPRGPGGVSRPMPLTAEERVARAARVPPRAPGGVSRPLPMPEQSWVQDNHDLVRVQATRLPFRWRLDFPAWEGLPDHAWGTADRALRVGQRRLRRVRARGDRGPVVREGRA